MLYVDLTMPTNSGRAGRTVVKDRQQMLTFVRLATDGTLRQRGREGS